MADATRHVPAPDGPLEDSVPLNEFSVTDATDQERISTAPANVATQTCSLQLQPCEADVKHTIPSMLQWHTGNYDNIFTVTSRGSPTAMRQQWMQGHMHSTSKAGLSTAHQTLDDIMHQYLANGFKSEDLLFLLAGSNTALAKHKRGMRSPISGPHVAFREALSASCLAQKETMISALTTPQHRELVPRAALRKPFFGKVHRDPNSPAPQPSHATPYARRSRLM